MLDATLYIHDLISIFLSSSKDAAKTKVYRYTNMDFVYSLSGFSCSRYPPTSEESKGIEVFYFAFFSLFFFNSLSFNNSHLNDGTVSLGQKRVLVIK